MFKNYLKIALRNLLRNRGFSALNIVGLSIGLTATALIVLWINYEVGFDGFHKNKNRIYQIYNKHFVDGEIWTWNSTPRIMGPTIKSTYPEVERMTRYSYDETFLFSIDDKRLKSTGTIVDPDFLHIFTFPLLKGSKETVLADVNSVVITESLSHNLFGKEDPIGKVVKIDNSELFTVSGVLKDLPENSDFKFEFLIPWAYLKQIGVDDKFWGNNTVDTYIMLKEGVSYADFSNKIKNLRETHDKENLDMITYPYPYSRNHLYGEFKNGVEQGGKIQIIQLFGIIAFIILVIACINFMNLSTARSQKRAKEVGIRKVIGAERGKLVGQFIGESILLSTISAVVGFILLLLVLPYFSNLLNLSIELDLANPFFWISCIAIILFTGLLAGSYPAFYLSAFKPASVLKGTFQKINSNFSPRKVLVVLQFAVAIILITATLIIQQQLNKVQNRQLGYTKELLVHSSMDGDLKKKYPLVKKDLLSSGVATSVTKTMSPITENWSNSWNISWPGKDPNDNTLILRFSGDAHFAETFGLQLVQGRDFDHKAFPTDSTGMIINETMAQHMKLSEPIGHSIKDMGQEWKIIGVVKDFVMTSPYQRIEPIIIHGKHGNNFINMRLSSAPSVSENLAKAEEIFKKYNPEYPFNYAFVDQEYARKFNDQKRIKTLSSLSALLTIFISCLGLFGLASYMAENRIKEIGVRKVLGASVSNITTLLSKEFLKLVLISCCLAIPLSWYFMNGWLERFEYRTTISWWVFIIAGVLAMAIALLTVSWQAIKAATTNPVKSLRAE